MLKIADDIKTIVLTSMTFASPFDAVINWGAMAEHAVDMDERIAELTGSFLAYLDVIRSFKDFLPVLRRFGKKMKIAAKLVL